MPRFPFVFAILAAFTGLVGPFGCAGTSDVSSADAGPRSDAAGDRRLDGSAIEASAPSPAPLPATAWPLEVLGEPGIAVSLTINVPEAIAASPEATLELSVDNVVADNAAYVEWTGAASVDLATVPGILRPFGGVGRGSLRIPAGGLHAGENTIAFRYTRQVRDVSGFRVLAAAVVATGGRATPELPWADPQTWKAPLPGDETVAAGRRYFTQESRDGGPTCAKCHANDGADLAYFSFSNFSIEARSRHHLFSPQESRAIASYVRSLSVPSVGRVYDAPFQPGKGFHGAAGAGSGAQLKDDAAFGAALKPQGYGDTISWSVFENVDPAYIAMPVATPSWLRWLPRRIDETWFTLRGGLLTSKEAALEDPGTLADARAFQAAAIQIGKDLLVAKGDHGGRIELLRYAAVKLWDWQRRHGGFDAEDHGFPNLGPAVPYEVGFAFFEAALANAVPKAMEQTFSWWAAQIAVNPGRGFSNGERPLNWRDVLVAADSAGQGPEMLTFLHLLGSFEESRGALADDFGTDRGPVRLLEIPLARVVPEMRVLLMLRYLAQESSFLSSGGTLTVEHHTVLARAWRTLCTPLTAAQRSDVRAHAPSEVAQDLTACP